MQVSVTNTSTLGRKLTINVPSEKLKLAIQDKLNELSKTARMDGFRQGNLPKEMLEKKKKLVEKKYGAQVRQEAVGKIIDITLPEALEKNALKPAGRPVVEEISEQPDELRYIVSFEIFPDITLKDFKDIQVEKHKVDITESDLEKAITQLQDQFAEWNPVERGAETGDKVVVDYESTLNGKPYENSKSQDVAVIMGKHLFIEGFEQGLMGCKTGDKKELDLVFPKDWRIEALASKPVHFSITVKGVFEKKVAELNDAFAKKIGCKDAEKDTILQKVKEGLERQVKGVVEAKQREQVIDRLIEQNPVELPSALIQNEINALHDELHRQMGQEAHGNCHDHSTLEPQAKRRVALGLILKEVVKLEKILPDENRVRSRISEISKQFSNAEFIESMYYESEELLSGIRNSVLVDQAVDFVLSKSTIIEKPMTVEALFKRH